MERSGIDRAFSPQIIRRQRKNGQNIDMMFDLLPGYVFAYSNRVVKEVSRLKVDGVIRLLGSPNDDYCLQEEDQSFALGLLERNGLIDVINVLQIGETVMLSDKFFSGFEGKIIQIDYRKQRAKISFSFSEMCFSTWVACNIILPSINLNGYYR